MWTREEEETEPDSAKQCFPPGARSNLTLPKPGSLPSPERGSFSRHKRNLALGQHLKTHQCFPLVDSYLEHLGLPCAAQHLLHSPLQLKGLHTGHSCCQNVLFSPLHLFSTYQSLRNLPKMAVSHPDAPTVTVLSRWADTCILFECPAPLLGGAPFSEAGWEAGWEAGRQVCPEEALPLFSWALASECGREVWTCQRHEHMGSGNNQGPCYSSAHC